MKYRDLGRTGLSVSELGLGTVEIGRDWGIEVPGDYGCPTEEDSLKLLGRAVELGVNFLDTARYYGTSEERIGRFLAGLGPDSGKVHVATKIPADKSKGLRAMREGMKRALESSLRALGREPIELVQIHSARLEDITDSAAWEVLDAARTAGKLRFIGASFYDDGAARAAVECGAYEAIQVTFNPAMSSAGAVIDLAGEREVGVIVKTPLLKGAFSNKREHLAEGMKPAREAVEAFGFLRRGDQTLPQACIRYCLARPGVSTVIAGTRKIEHLEENVEAVEGTLEPGEVERISELQESIDFSEVKVP